MKKFLLFSILTAILVSGFAFDADAQRRKKKKKKKKKAQDEYFDESGNIAAKLWYGSGGTLRFNSFQGQSTFNIGLSPMVGYKINEPLSAGIRAEIDYFYLKLSDFNESFVFNQVSWGIGPFVRAKFWQLFFHGEFTHRNLARPFDETGDWDLNPNDPSKIQSYRYPQNKLNLGLGYTSGGIVSYEIAILYDVLEDVLPDEIPFEIRAGLTYKF